MKQILFLVCSISVLFMACSASKKGKNSLISQGLTGKITELSGNQMPLADAPKPVPKGILTTLYVYESTLRSQVQSVGNAPIYTSIATKRVASVDTDSTGNYTVTLPPGSYSLFVKLGDQFYANLFNEKDQIALFTVEEGRLTTANLTVSVKAKF